MNQKNIDGHVMIVYTTYPVSPVLALKLVGLVAEMLTLPAVFYVTTLRVRFPTPEYVEIYVEFCPISFLDAVQCYMVRSEFCMIK